MRLSDFDYRLPKELIAQSPIEPRDASRLMVLGRTIKHTHFSDILDYLAAGDTLVLNDSRVIPAKLRGKKGTGGHVEALVVRKADEGYECLIQGKNIRKGTRLLFDDLEAMVIEAKKDGAGARYIVDFNCNGDMDSVLERIGEAPLPPYIKEELKDRERYQTIFAKEKGSIAAPTAGLHFTDGLLKKIRQKGVNIAYVTLHVSPGTFTPVKTHNIEEHMMEQEFVSITAENAEIINSTEGKLIASGTTAVKALESSCEDGRVTATAAFSKLFIYPPYRFRSGIDAMITNFHLPGSTLLMLVSAFAGRDRLLHAYEEAILNSYRFYSFGDAMLVFR